MFLSATPEALGQTTRPNVYIWDGAYHFENDEEFLLRSALNAADELVNFAACNAESSPSAAAAVACEQIREFLQNAPTAYTGRIAIIIQNFGRGTNSSYPCSFFTEADEILDIGTWPDLSTGSPQPVRANPWMIEGRQDCAVWMEGFLDAYDTWWANPTNADGLTKPIPDRFHFDTEMYITGACNPNFAHHFWRTTLNTARWGTFSTAGVDLPGFGMDGYSLWAEAASHYGWESVPEDQVEEDLAVCSIDDNDNQTWHVWWQHVCRHIMESVMDEVAYTVIKSHNALTEAAWADCKVSNYESADLDGAADTSMSWHLARADSTRSPSAPTSTAWTRTAFHGMPDATYGTHSAYTSTILPAPDSGWSYRIGREWLNGAGTRLGDFDAPSLYAILRNEQYRQPVVYTKLESYDHDEDTYTSNATLEDRWLSSLRLHRHQLESITHQSDEAADSLAVWFQPANTYWETTNQAAASLFKEYQLRQQECMFRAFDVHELLSYNPLGCRRLLDNTVICSDMDGQPIDVWMAFSKIYNQVYDPTLVAFDVLRGTGSPDNADETDPEELERLWYVKPFEGDEYGLSIECQKPFQMLGNWLYPYPLSSDLEVTFENVDPFTFALQLNVESSVFPAEFWGTGEIPAFDPAEMTGRVFAWDWEEGDWVDVTVTSLIGKKVDGEYAYALPYAYEMNGLPDEEEVSNQTEHYGFYTPYSDSTYDRVDARRVFVFEAGMGDARFVSAGEDNDSTPGVVKVKLVHLLYQEQSSNPTTAGFTSFYDLDPLTEWHGVCGS